MRAVAALFLLCLSAVGQAPPKSAFDRAALEQWVRHLFVWGPHIDVKVSEPAPAPLPGFKQVSVVASAGNASQEEIFYVSADGRKLIRGSVYDIGTNPFEADARRIATERQPSFGPADAPVVLVVYSDFQCTYCRQEAQILRQQLAKEYPKQVRVHFKDFPLDPIHPWARPAAIAGRCIYRQQPAAFWDYHDWIFEKQPSITVENLKQNLQEFAKTNGLDATRLNACLDGKATESEVNESMADARALGVNSTPTVFVNGRRLAGSVPWANLKQVIDHEIAYAGKNAAAASCCEVKLPVPGAQ